MRRPRELCLWQGQSGFDFRKFVHAKAVQYLRNCPDNGRVLGHEFAAGIVLNGQHTALVIITVRFVYLVFQFYLKGI